MAESAARHSLRDREYMGHECLNSSLAFHKPAIAVVSRHPARTEGHYALYYHYCRSASMTVSCESHGAQRRASRVGAGAWRRVALALQLAAPAFSRWQQNFAR